MKKIVSLFLVCTMLFGLVACGGGSKSNKKQKITAWAWDKNFNVAALEEAKRIYLEKNPGTELEIEIVEYAQKDVIQKLNTGLSSGSTDGLPNIVLIEDYRAQMFLKSYPGSFSDLSSITDPKKFADYKLEFMTDGDKIYGVPFDNGCAVLYYRRDLIEKAGYTDEDMQDLTWEEYIELGKKLKEKTGVKLLTLDPNDVAQIRMIIQSAGKWYIKEDGTPNLKDNETLKEAVRIYMELLNSGNAEMISEWSQFVGAPNDW